MGKITSYTPTAGLTSEQRTQSGYYEAIKAWAGEMEIFKNFFNVSFDDENFTVIFTPLDENLQFFTLKITVSQSSSNYYVYFYMKISTNSNYGEKGMYWDMGSKWSKDFKFRIFETGNSIAIGGNSDVPFYGIYSASSYAESGKKQPVILTRGTVSSSIANASVTCVQGTSYNTYYESGVYNRPTGGTSDVYRILQMPVYGTDLMFNDIYYFDGGMSLPPADFTVGKYRYCSLHTSGNICLKI